MGHVSYGNWISKMYRGLKGLKSYDLLKVIGGMTGFGFYDGRLIHWFGHGMAS